MIKKLALVVWGITSLTACSTMFGNATFDKPSHLLFQQKNPDSIVIQIKRDDKLCQGDQLNDQKCPIKFYIDDLKAGDFYVNNKTKYYLSPNDYVLKVKNCAVNCFVSDLKISLNSSKNNMTYTLSLDESDKPYIIQQ